MSPISSRKIVPVSAISNLPRFCWLAPVKEPFSWPKSSLSSRVSASAAQLTATKGLDARSPALWMARATSSLPVPLSPWIKTVLRRLAISEHSAMISCIRGFLLMTSCTEYCRVSFLRRMVFSRCRFFTLMMRLTSSEISSGLHGLTMYSCAIYIVHRVVPCQCLAQDGVLALQVLHFDDAVDQQRDFLRIARLDDVLLRAFLHGGDGRVHGGVGRDDDDGGLGMQVADLHHGFDAVHAAGHFQVDEVDCIVAQACLLDGIVAGGRRVHDVAVLTEPCGERLAHHLLVVHYQNLPVSLHNTCPPSGWRRHRAPQASQNASSFKSIWRTAVASDIAHLRSAQCTSPNRWPVSWRASL